MSLGVGVVVCVSGMTPFEGPAPAITHKMKPLCVIKAGRVSMQVCTVSMHSEYADMLWHWMATNGELNTEHLLPICTHVQYSKLYKKVELNYTHNERNDWNEKSVDLEIWGWRSFCQSLILSLLLLENDPGMLSQHSSSIRSNLNEKADSFKNIKTFKEIIVCISYLTKSRQSNWELFQFNESLSLN